MKWVALAIAAIYTVIYFYGGPVYASCACNAAGRKTLPYYFIGIGVVLLYFPLWAYRKYVEDKRVPPATPATAMPAPIAGASEP
jgi:hypothetical protein